MIIISCGNSIGDLFNNGALSKIGNSLMGYMACFSGQSFNLFAGLIVYFIVSDEKTFDIFGLHDGLKVKNKLMIYLFCSAFFVILLNFWIAKSNYYIIRSD